MIYITVASRAQLVARASALLALAAAAGCSGGDLVLPQAGTGVNLSVVSGNQQTGVVGEQLPKPLLVELRDDQGHAIVGRKVTFVATGGPADATLTPEMATTDGDGQAVGKWVLGKKPGDYAAEARLVASPDDQPDTQLPSVTFSASATAGEPDTLRALSAAEQSGQARKPAPNPPVVRVTDRFGNPVPGVTVHWAITSGGGSVSSDAVATDADGQATVVWTLGDRFVISQLTATVDGDPEGSPVVFTALGF